MTQRFTARWFFWHALWGALVTLLGHLGHATPWATWIDALAVGLAHETGDGDMTDWTQPMPAWWSRSFGVSWIGVRDTLAFLPAPTAMCLITLIAMVIG